MIYIKEYKFDEFTDWDFLKEDTTTATFFQQKIWLELWMKYWGNNGSAKIFAVFSDNILIGIAPMHITSDRINILGVPDPILPGSLSDFGDIIAKISFEKKVWEKVLAILKSEKSKIELNYIREESPSFKILKDLGGKEKQMDVAPFIDLPETWDQYLLSLDRHNRHEIRRKMKRIDEESVSQICDGINTQNINDFFRLMIVSNEKKNNFLSEDMKSFFTEVIMDLGQKKLLTLCFLRYNNENIAGILMMYQKNEILLYNAGYDPKFSYLSPGLMLNVYAIKQAIEKRMKKFDFLRGNEGYKFDLGAKERKLYKITFD